MSFNTNLTRLNFHYDEMHKTMIEKKLGLKISLGLVSGLRGGYRYYQTKNQGFSMCLQEQGMPQDELDRLCMSIADQAQSLGYDVLATKSDLPFDNRWFLMGDLRPFLEAGRMGKINIPFSNFMYATIIVELEEYETHEEGDT